MGATPDHKPQKEAAKLPQLPFQKRKQLERDIEHVTAEMYKRNMELAETNKTLSLLRAIDAVALESHTSLEEMCQRVTEAIAQTTEYPFVGLFTLAAHNVHHLTLYGLSGSSMPGKTPLQILGHPLHVAIDYAWLDDPATGKLIDLEKLSHAQLVRLLGIGSDELARVHKQVPVKSLYILKLQVRRRLVGVLAVGFLTPVAQLSEAETLLLDRLSESIGVALDNRLLFEENQHVLRQLKISNTKLKALDETKDDFISMASHQLRTPLTSVKGYISMILEGDTGKITQTQREMLGQAFFSSQRMVYLIADLLNVSRLKTGKFIIERAPLNLATVVEQEISQLRETAATRSLTISYEKPASFPELLLDETKTRQVIMNFTDNAIYYTPAKGHITVRLIDKPQTIELRVEDNGIGVPKSEQAHLFTKFYRAGNARVARPDGTGLGLFMAKKVIIAQGGSLIFESQEGKGSTFGFIFSKAKLAAEVTPVPPIPVAAVKVAPTPVEKPRKRTPAKKLAKSK